MSHVVGSKPTIGESVGEINANINLDYLVKRRTTVSTAGRKELDIIAGAQAQHEKGQRVRKQSADEIVYQTECAKKFKRLSANFVFLLIAQSSTHTALRGLQAQ